MSLFDTKRDLQMQARRLPDKYENYNINILADGYCKALDENDETNKSIYLSALLLRFWYKIDRMYQAVKNSGFEREDVFYRLYECINAACQYRAWQNPEKNTNAQACINQVISGRGVPAMIYEANLHKNTRGLTILDETLDDETGTTRGDLIEDETSTDFVSSAKDIVYDLLSQSKVVEAIIADHIANRDVFKHEKKAVVENSDGEKYKYYNHSTKFWPFKLVQELNTIDDKYIKYFENTYDVDSVKLTAAIESLNKAPNQKKYKFIKKTITSLRACFNIA